MKGVRLGSWTGGAASGGQRRFRNRIGAARAAEEQLRAGTDVPVIGLPALADDAPIELQQSLSRRLGDLMQAE